MTREQDIERIAAHWHRAFHGWKRVDACPDDRLRAAALYDAGLRPGQPDTSEMDAFLGLRPLATEGDAAPGGTVHDLRATIEAMSGDAADLTDLMDEAAALRTALAHVLVRTHDSGCGTCDAARALLTAEHELPSNEALAAPPPVPRDEHPDAEQMRLRAEAAEAALRDGAIPAMRFAARRLAAIEGERQTADDLRADADQIEIIARAALQENADAREG